jgi:hypothetical protein|tara:strand:+ start:544 stop:681 length:138 start_codon:yes stop_codon:yes gene_type:complete
MNIILIVSIDDESKNPKEELCDEKPPVDIVVIECKIASNPLIPKK